MGQIRYCAIAAITLVLVIGAGHAEAGPITEAFTAGTASTSNDGASYFGGGSKTLTLVSLSLSWDDAATYSCTNTATDSRCVLQGGQPTAMSASFAGTYNSNSYSFTVDSDASTYQNTHSPEGGSLVDASQYFSGTKLHFYVVGQNILEAGDIYSSVAFNSNSVLDPAFMSSVEQNVTGIDWFVSTAWDQADSTYYPNGGDYFDSFGTLGPSEQSGPTAPEPATWLSLAGGLGALVLMKRLL